MKLTASSCPTVSIETSPSPRCGPRPTHRPRGYGAMRGRRFTSRPQLIIALENVPKLQLMPALPRMVICWPSFAGRSSAAHWKDIWCVDPST